jgi:hypothetical protein
MSPSGGMSTTPAPCTHQSVGSIKVRKKEYDWSVGLVYDSKELTGVMTARLEMAEVLQMVSEPTLAIARVHTGQLRRIR